MASPKCLDSQGCFLSAYLGKLFLCSERLVANLPTTSEEAAHCHLSGKAAKTDARQGRERDLSRSIPMLSKEVSNRLRGRGECTYTSRKQLGTRQIPPRGASTCVYTYSVSYAYEDAQMNYTFMKFRMWI